METTKSLTRIVSPTLNDANIANSLTEAINVINENFRILSSTPFLQGVKGDTYHTSTQHIFELKNDIVTVTSAGALLLNSIFGLSGDNTIKKDDKYKGENSVKDKIKNVTGNSDILGCPIDSLIEFENDIPVKLINNDLYFYTLIDDAGNEYGEQLGQYYYFIDNRIKNLGTAYNKEDKTDLIKFVDYSGFYRYVPANDTDEAHYEKVGFLPSLYYDTKNNDICWKYYDEETGLSAIGPKGATGDSSVLKIVRIDNPIYGQTYGEISAVTTTKDISLSEISLWPADAIEIAKIEENTPLIICFKNGTKYDISFGIAKKIKIENQTKICGVWDANSVLDTSINTKTINEYFESINNTGNNDDPKYLKIPYGSDGNGEHINKMHTIKGDKNGGLLLRSNNFSSGRFILDDYSIVCTTYNSDNENKSKYTSISNDGITVNSSNGNIIISYGSISLPNVDIGAVDYNDAISAHFQKPIIADVGFTYEHDKNQVYSLTKRENNYVGMPIGSIIMYYGYIPNINSTSAIEIGNCWLLCNGANLGPACNRNIYNTLIQKIGNTLPDFRNLYPRGCGDIGGLVGYKGGQDDVKIKYETGNKIKMCGGIGVPATDVSDIGFYVNDSKKGTKTEYQKKRVDQKVINSFANSATKAGIGVITSSECTIPTEPPYITVNFLIKYR